MYKDGPEIAAITSDIIKMKGHKIIGNTGVTGTILVDKFFPTIAVRAEIDALPITEQKGKASVFSGTGFFMFF